MVLKLLHGYRLPRTTFAQSRARQVQCSKRSLARDNPSLHANASNISGSVMAAMTNAKAPKNQPNLLFLA
jgi:hypothetical protein